MTKEQENISRLTFGKMTSVEQYKMTPCINGKVGALILEKKKGSITEDVVLVFDSTMDIDVLVSKLKDVKRLMFNEGKVK